MKSMYNSFNIEKKVIIPRILKIVKIELIKISFKSFIGENKLNAVIISFFILLNGIYCSFVLFRCNNKYIKQGKYKEKIKIIK